MAIDRGFTIPIGVDSSQAIAGINAVIKKLQDGLVSVEDAVKGVASVLNEEYEIRNVIRTSVDDKGLRQAEALQEKYLKTSEQIVREAKKAIQVEAGSVANLKGRLSAEAQSLNNIRKYNQEIGTSGAILLTVNQRWAEQNQRVKELQQQLRIANANNPFARIGAEADLGGLLRIGKKLTDIVNIFQSINIVVGQAVAFVNQFATALNRIQQLELVFKGIGAGASGATQALGESSRIALGLGADLNIVRDGFTKLTPAVLAAGGTIGDTSAIIEALSSRFALFGMSADQSSRVMNGVIQAFGKGKLMAEELTQQISEADPAFRTDLAAAIGVTVAQLGEMVKAGDITSKKLIEYIPLLSKSSVLFGQLGTSAVSAAESFGKTGVTVDRIRTQFANLNQLNIEAVAKQFAPLLQALLVVQGAVIDFGTELRKLESFQTLANIINFTGQVLAKLTQIVLGTITAIVKLAEPVFALINLLIKGATAIDNWANKVAGIKPIATAVGLVITAALIAPLTTLATNTIALAVGSIARLSGSLSGLAATGFASLGSIIPNIIASIKTFGTTLTAGTVGTVGKAITAMTSLGTATATTAAAAAASTASYLPPAAALEGLKTQMIGTATAGTGAAGGIGATAAAAASATPAVTGFGAALKTVLATLLPFAVILAGIASAALVFDVFKRGSETAAESSNKLKESLAKLRSEADELKATLPELGDDSAQFARKVDNALKAPDVRSSWQKLGDFIKQTNSASLMDVINTASGFSNEFKRINADAKVLKDEFSKLNLGELDEDSVQQLGSQVDNMVDQYNVLVENAKIARDSLYTKSKEGQLFGEEAAALKAFDADIQKFTAKRDALIAEAQNKQIPLKIKVDPVDDQLKKNIDKIKLDLEKLEANNVKLKVNTTEYDAAQFKIGEVSKISDALQGKNVKLKIDVDYEAAKQNLQNMSEIQGAITDNIAAQQTYHQSITGILKAQSDYRVQRLQDAGASEELIKQEQERGNAIVIEGLKVRLSGLKQAQESERIALDLKQKLALLDAQSALAKAKQAEAANRQLQSELQIAQLEAQKSGDTDKVNAIAQQLELAKQQQQLNEQEVTNAGQRLQTLQEIFDLERGSLALKQAAEENNLKAELASLGVAVNITNAYEGLQMFNGEMQNTSSSIEAAGGAVSNLANTAMPEFTDSVIDNQGQWSNLEQNINQAGEAVQNLPQPEFEAPDDIPIQVDEGSLKDFSDAIKEAGEDAADGINQGLNEGAEGAEGVSSSGMAEEVSSAAESAKDLEGSLSTGVQKANALFSAIQNLDSLSPTVTVTLVGVNSRWTGGPVKAGQQYQVNELGKEAFLSATGRLSMINKPRNAMWRPTSSGTVIPAHIAAGLDIPSTGIKVSTETVSGVSRAASRANNNSNSAGIGRAIANALLTSGIMQSNRNLSATQSEQAVQLGKLTHAVNRLSDKNWDVRVNVQDSGAASLINRVNRML